MLEANDDPELGSPSAAPGGPAWQDASQSREGLAALAMLALLAVVVGLIYSGAVRAPFVFDDLSAIVENPSILSIRPLLGNSQHPGPLTPPKDITTAGRPLVNLSLAVNYRLGGLNPVGYHIFNMFVHVLAALLVWAIVRRALLLGFFQGKFEQTAGLLAALVALVWTVHPLQTDAVEYISQRTELMMGFCYLATLYCSMRYFDAAAPRARMAWLVFAALVNAAGMGCKEVMVSAPVMVLLFDRTFVAGSFRRAWRKSWPLYLVLALGWGILVALNYGGPRSQTAGFHLAPAYMWWFTQCRVLVMYLTLAFWPWPLAIHYHVPILQTLGAAFPWVLAAGTLALGAFVLFCRRYAVGFLGAWIIAILSPTLVVPIATEIAAERRMYLPLAAIVALVIVGGCWLVDRALRRIAEVEESRPSRGWSSIQITTISALCLALVLAMVSVRRLTAFRDALTLWQDAVANQPDDPMSLVSFGVALTNAGRPLDAIKCLERALQIEPDRRGLFIHRQFGLALAAAGRFPEAIDQLREALKLEPDSPPIHQLLGMALVNAARPQEAIEQFEIVLRERPDLTGVHDNMGVALLNAGRPREAIVELEEALRLNPDNISALANVAIAYARVDRVADAVGAIEKALAVARSKKLQPAIAPLEARLREYRSRLPKP